ncbi:hypothetical protein R6Q57_015754 [Mikania cordata]
MALARFSRNWKQSSGAYAINRSITNKEVPIYYKAETADTILCLQSLTKVDHMRFESRGTHAIQGYRFVHAERIPKDYSDSNGEKLRYGNLEATKPGDKPRVVVLGCGWAASEPVRRVQSALAKDPNSCFYLASCTAIDTDKHEVYCETVGDKELSYEPYRVKVAYDKLVIASGSEPLTFGIKGVKEHAYFLREHFDPSYCMWIDSGISEEEKEQMLHCIVIGGGPTGVEFSGELSDFIVRDVCQRYAHVKNYVCVTLIEYGVRLVRGVVKEVHPKKLILCDGSVVPYGLLVWSTGVSPSEFIKQLNLPKSPGGRVGVDEWLRVPSVEDVFALGDCAGFLEHTGKPVLPALAQVAERQGKYLVELFNKKIGKQNAGKASSAKDIALGDPFVYKHLGSMASVGRYKALVDLTQSQNAKGLSMAGWRSAYLTRVLSWRNRFYVMINWATTLVFGRDNSRIG